MRDTAKFAEYIRMIASMCADYLIGNLTPKAFLSNLKIAVKHLEVMEQEK
jgi:hypothetical protein